MKYSLSMGLILFGIWLLWSGHYTPMLIGFGAGSCLLVILISRRMKILDEEGVPLQLGLRPFTFYLPWLIKEIVISNLDVAWRIVHPRLPISPRMIRVKASQKRELSRVIYANSITLTPGTVSIDMTRNEILVHALTRVSARLEHEGDMDRRVSQLEGAD